MDNATRIKALARLVQSSDAEAQQALQVELDEAIQVLSKSSRYEALEFALDVLGTIGPRFSESTVAAIDTFNRSIEERRLEYSRDYDGLRLEISKYRNAHTLISKGIEVLSGLRYLQTPKVTTSLLWASTHPVDRVCRDGLDALASLAKYNITVFFGDERRTGIGAQPQAQVVALLQSMGQASLVQHFAGAIKLLEGMLSTAMERTEWSSSSMTLHRGVTPATSEVVSVRTGSIAILRRLFSVMEDVRSKLTVIRTLSAATRQERGAAMEGEYAAMIAQNTRSVLAFFAEVVPSAELQIVQKIEHSSYWIYFHAVREDVKEAALAVKAAVDANDEYTIFKTLIGFEGIFGDWVSDERNALREHASQERRGALADEYARGISQGSMELWRGRILRFAATESDDLATFPVFYRFLEQVALYQPKLALSLLVDNAATMTPFAIPLLKGLWDGAEKENAREVIDHWIKGASRGSSHRLLAAARTFLSTKEIDLPLLQRMFSKASELQDIRALNQIAAVSIARFHDAGESAGAIKQLFLSTLQVLTELRDANWVRDIWFREEAKALVAQFDPLEVRAVLANLSALSNIDFQSEEILSELAKVDPDQVIEFFCFRADQDNPSESDGGVVEDGYEAIPFEFHHLQEPLSAHPDRAIHIVRKHFKVDQTLFQFRGAKLLQNIFPVFSEGFEAELMQLVQSGDELDMEFVLGVLSAYSGEDFLYPICKAIVRRVSPGDALLRSVEFVLESTGVVMGEHGMSEAYEQKRLSVLPWLEDQDDNVRAFARSYISNLEALRDGERRRETEGIALRKFRHGEL